MLVLGFSVKKEVLRRTAEDFSKFSNGRMKGCVMAVDGWVCGTRQPSVKEVGINIKSYRNSLPAHMEILEAHRCI